MKSLLYSLLVTALILPLKANAIDAFAKIKKQRPAVINLDTTLMSGGLTITYKPVTEDNLIPLNQIHNWLVTLSRRDGSAIDNADIDMMAEMPEHLHGMTTQPKIIKTAIPGEYLIAGMNFHMPGWWVASFDVSGYGSRALIRFHLVVGEGDSASDMTDQHKSMAHDKSMTHGQSMTSNADGHDGHTMPAN